RRMVLKRCIYGVDKNPLTVELAKVSLWLHSFTVGAPLSFLDHHLRAGDSLLGLRVAEATTELNRLAGLSLSSATAGAEAATKGMRQIEEMSDADISEVHESAALFHKVEETTADLRGLLDLLCGMRWLTAGMRARDRTAFWAPLLSAIEDRLQDAAQLLAHGPDDETPVEYGGRWGEASEIIKSERFLHWEVAFPGVWTGWGDAQPDGGFDAIIGNPPWDRIKLQEVEWFALRAPAIAQAPTAAARRAAIDQLREERSPLAREFDAEKARADTLGRMVRASGHYPLLAGGDINLYSLFIERATALVKPDGFVGLLTPSGIYADKTAARFFQSVSTNGRVDAVFDFENRKIFFKDVHASFKFCALILGGTERRFDRTSCAFFLHDVATIKDSDRCFPLTPADFARVNPNTGTAPVFRTRRDADITRGIYERHPVLVDRSSGEERRAWEVRHHRQFDMTNDSHLFRDGFQLESKGFYPIELNRWKKGDELYLPLYQGLMIHNFDHRAGSVKVNRKNVHNPYVTEHTTSDDHVDPEFLPDAAYWVPVDSVSPKFPQSMGWTLVYRRITRPTDARTTVATVVPWSGVSYTLPMLLPVGDKFPAPAAACLLSTLASFCFDYVSRQKLQGASMSLTSLEQLPVIAPADYDRRFGDTTARDLVRDHVLRLTYTAHDMAPFARDLGYDGDPFIWNDEERRHLRARLDALYFHLYGLDREGAKYVLSTFPIVRKEDEKQFGRYRTRDLILAYMNALDVGDTETVVDL
ncbi:MAG: restriction endonuclease, partial [Chloroflexi bacterium]|nr:restriction endonuclease [Chloroflexota bacterium]